MKLVRLYIGHHQALKSGGTLVHTDINVREAIESASRDVGLRSYTLVPALGAWQGGSEQTTIVELAINEIQLKQAHKMARLLRDDLGQQCVLFTVQDAHVEFVGAVPEVAHG